MSGQIIALLYEQGGVYYTDLLHFLADTNSRELYD
jgi:hypothetical protein